MESKVISDNEPTPRKIFKEVASVVGAIWHLPIQEEQTVSWTDGERWRFANLVAAGLIVYDPASHSYCEATVVSDSVPLLLEGILTSYRR